AGPTLSRAPAAPGPGAQPGPGTDGQLTRPMAMPPGPPGAARHPACDRVGKKAQARPGGLLRAQENETSHAGTRTAQEGPPRGPAPRRPGGRRRRRPAAERTSTMKWHTAARRWLRRVRGWWPDRNPLRRRCDRAEAALVTVLVAVFLAGAPLLAVSAGRWPAQRGAPRAGPVGRLASGSGGAAHRHHPQIRPVPGPAPGPVDRPGRGDAPRARAGPGGVRRRRRHPGVGGCGRRLAGPPAQPGWFGSRAPAEGMVAVLLLAELLWGAGWLFVAAWTGAAWRRGKPNGGPSGRRGAVTPDRPAD